MKKALFFEQFEKGKVKCTLCPHNCNISEGKAGICLVRKNINGDLLSENYERVSAVTPDPIEEKPLYHFYPGNNILSVGSVGCNLKCKFCQNYEISQASVLDYSFLKSYTSGEIVEMGLSQPSNIGVAYTYNEPIIWYEYLYETTKMIHEAGLNNVMITNGSINPEPLEQIMEFIDAFSVDLKGFTEEFYSNLTSSRLEPVLSSIKQIKAAGKHLEITNLVITGLNDNEKIFTEMIDWIATEIGSDTVLHISRYFPMFKINSLPTPQSKLETLYGIAKQKLDYVYLGNTKSKNGQDTFCPECGELSIHRFGYSTTVKNMDSLGNCTSCSHPIIKYL
ncbi:MAG: AmmeMemoRadiSam system radical SAM enzyme [Bacteroidetes bacterium]|nr:AmmeMemoRadiSam system radical SAM enzyme [Bacteroidota bacterium]